jgi:transcriptional regulator with XRE-family HTH domain
LACGNVQTMTVQKAIGTKIRIERKKSGLTLEKFAKKLGISAITLQRIETGKSSPSVVLLSEIANAVDKPIVSFFEESIKSFVQIKRKNQRTISSPMLKIKLIGPRNIIADNIVVTYGELKKGKKIDPHTNRGIEFNYNIEGKSELKLNGRSYFLEAGDSSAFDARLEHSVTALETLKFFGIYVEDKE